MGVTKLEQIARARYAAWLEEVERMGLADFPPWDELESDEREKLLAHERLVIQAMMEPSTEMLIAGERATESACAAMLRLSTDDYALDVPTPAALATQAYQLMLQAILTESDN